MKTGHDDHPSIPTSPESEVWDVVVIGTGMGGATCGYELARLGKSVLFLERGFVRYAASEAELEEKRKIAADSRLALGMWPEMFTRNPEDTAQASYPPVGCGAGGGTARYAAVLDRFFPEDFQPGRWYARGKEAAVPETWPISYEQLSPFYEEAEALYRVRGSEDPLRPGHSFRLMPPPPLTAKESLIAEKFARVGLHPYRLHQGLEFVPGCEKCVSDLCDKECKNDAGRICLQPALEHSGAKVLPRCEVRRFRLRGIGIESVECDWRGRRIDIRARLFVLAAGAFNSPRILLSSTSSDFPDGIANRTGLVGRNLMLHVSEGVIIKPKGRQPAPEFNTGVSINDFYFDGEEKLGNFHAHSFVMNREVVRAFLKMQADYRPGLLQKLAAPLHPALAAAGAFVFGGTVGFTSIIEDLPYARNRVLPPAPDEGGAVRYEYHFSDELERRVRRARTLFHDRIRGEFSIVSVGIRLNLNTSHVCGTCRFGDDSDASVLDPTNRAHDVDNLYVVDASFFPTSGGMNPSLTIAANALRVARIMSERNDS